MRAQETHDTETEHAQAIEIVRLIKMGFGDTSVKESVDRHDHNSVVEGNVFAPTETTDELRVCVIVVCVLLFIFAIAFAIRHVTNMCVEKIVRAVRRDETA